MCSLVFSRRLQVALNTILKELEPRSIKMCLNIFTKLKFETIQNVITCDVGHNILLLCICIFFTSAPPLSTCTTSNITCSLKIAENCRFYCSISQIWMWPHLSTSLKLLKLRDIADMHLPAKFLRVLKCGQYIFYKFWKFQ